MDPAFEAGGRLDPDRHEHLWKMSGIGGAGRVLCRCDCGEEMEAETDWSQWRGWYGTSTAEEITIGREKLSTPPPESSPPTA